MDKKITLTDKNNIPFTIPYEIIRSRRKTCAIVLKEDASVTVRLPLYGKDADAERFLREKQFWISAKLSELQARKQEQQARQPETLQLTPKQRLALEQRYRAAAKSLFAIAMYRRHTATKTILTV